MFVEDSDLVSVNPGYGTFVEFLFVLFKCVVA